MKRPVIVIDFTDELVRQLTSDRVENLIIKHFLPEFGVDIATLAKMLGLCADEARKHAKKIPVCELGTGAKGNRYKIKDILAYRDKKTTQPK